MPILNISSLYQRIHSGAEGGHEFARLMKLLLGAHYDAAGRRFIAESDAAGDYKQLDAFLEGSGDFTELITGYHFKFYPSTLNPGQRKEIEATVEKAVKGNPLMRELILVTPEDFTKGGQAWFQGLEKKYANGFRAEKGGSTTWFTFQLTHWGHSKIIEMALRHEHIARNYFPELFPQQEGSFRLSFAGIDCNQSNWQPRRGEKNAYTSHIGITDKRLPSDPLFDFQFTNSTADIILLQSIDIHIKTATTLARIRSPYLLGSIGTIEHVMDFKAPINRIDLRDPIILQSRQPIRFSIQLKEFNSRAPGNYVYLTFWFNFDRYTIPTETFYLTL